MKTTSRTGAGLTSTVSGLTDDALLAQTRKLARIEQQLNVTVIDHLREIEARRLYLRRGFSSLFDYAVRELGYTDSAASRRINAMRLCKEFEEVREGLQDGSITLTTAAQLQNAFDRQRRNRRRRDRRNRREGLDRHDPGRPPRRPRTGNRSASGDGTSAAKAPASGSITSAPKTKRNPDRQARSAAHRNAQPTRAATSAPKRRAPAGRAIPAAVKRHVWNRDGGRCSYVDPRSRRRCASRHLLQIDHVFPYALGGRAEPANLRLLCATHHRHRHEGRASPREPAE